jgi:hypothetical protein
MTGARWLFSASALLALSCPAFAAEPSDDSAIDARKIHIEHLGGTSRDERAVAAALAWLAAQQLPDGGWSFVYEPDSPRPHHANPGTLRDARNLATAMALLPFAAAGQNHQDHRGKYRPNVDRGIQFLLRHASKHPQGLSFEDAGGGPFAHALATLVLCEIYARTRDQELYPSVQSACDYIAATQDQSTGGWRHRRDKPPGIMLATWNVLALKSAYMAYLKIDNPMVVRASKFMQSLQGEEGASFGMTEPGDEPAATAAGLLCRVYLGLKRKDPVGVAGLKRLDKAGPAEQDLVHNFFCTILLRMAGGDEWDRWNKRLRDPLVDSQAKSGDDKGSWYFARSREGKWGGRLYSTVMAALTLEVDFRHLSVFDGHWRVPLEQEDFPL